MSAARKSAEPVPDGIVHDLSFEQYLAADAVSKSRLWTLFTRSPAHALVDREQSNAMQLGTAIHCAVLEPDEFQARFVRGPDDRRGNRWKEALDEHGERLLTASDFDAALAVRDQLLDDPIIRRITGAGTVREASAFWTDPATGLRVRARPDAFCPALDMMVDLKSTTDARPNAFQRRVGELGYHVQEALYTDGWQACGGELRAFVFIAIETAAPFAHRIYELSPAAVAEGRAVAREALDRWADCVRTGRWPAYPGSVATLDLNKWDYRITAPPGA